MFVAGGSGTNTVAYSYDGITWTPSLYGNSIFDLNCLTIVWNGSIWVAGSASTNKIAYSVNGNNWYNSYNGNDIFAFYCNVIAWNGSIFVAGGDYSNSNSLFNKLVAICPFV